MPVRFVLCRPRFSENLGAAARALKNMGLRDWAVVASEVSELAGAERMAVQAEDVLRERREVATLHEAVSDCDWVVGTSSRKVRGKRRLSPREVAAEVAARRQVAIVFGDERSGLTNEEIDRCHDLSAVPTDDAQPSINLAQAVLLYAYEVKLASQVDEREKAPRAKPATMAELSQVEEALGATLRRGRFLKDEGRSAMRELFGTLLRSRLTGAEARLWLAALKTVEKALP